MRSPAPVPWCASLAKPKKPVLVTIKPGDRCKLVGRDQAEGHPLITIIDTRLNHEGRPLAPDAVMGFWHDARNIMHTGYFKKSQLVLVEAKETK